MNSKLSDVKVMDEDIVIQEIEVIIQEFNLTITTKTTLFTMKGSIHFHLKRGNLRGLLEVTYWPKHKRLWIEIHNNRRVEWNELMIKPFSERLAKQFGGLIDQRLE
jgi:hypothetical protein